MHKASNPLKALKKKMSLTGTPVIYGIVPHETSEVAKHQLGSKGVVADGRIYRYAQASAIALSPGLICVAPDITTAHEDRAVNTFAVGDLSITVSIGATAITGNEYEEGFVNIIDDNGQGIMYKIANCPPTAINSDVVIRLAEPIRVAAQASTTVTLYRNKYRDIVVSDTNQIDMPVGVPNVTFPGSYYGWIQTRGPCSILVDTNDTTATQGITLGNTDAGAVETWNGIAEPYVGIQPVGANSDAGEYGIYELRLD